MKWDLEEAKTKLDEIIELSLTKGPQIISCRGKDTAVIISHEEYNQLAIANES